MISVRTRDASMTRDKEADTHKVIGLGPELSDRSLSL